MVRGEILVILCLIICLVYLVWSVIADFRATRKFKALLDLELGGYGVKDE